MRQTQQMTADWSGLRPTRVVLALIVVTTVAYVVEMVGIRFFEALDVEGRPLALVPSDVLSGQVWQLATSVLLHSSRDASHLLWNMLSLWIFGTQLERERGSSAVLWSYVCGGLGGSVLQVILGALGLAMAGWTGNILDPLWGAPVVGASGATHAVALTWLALHADEVLNFILLGAIRGRTLILLYVVITLLQMLSFGNQAWGVHLGGMAVGAALGFGWVDPAKWRVFRRQRVLKKQARAIEAQLRVIEGGKQKPQPRQRGDDWIN